MDIINNCNDIDNIVGSPISACRLCNQSCLSPIYEFTPQLITSFFPHPEEFSSFSPTPISIVLCSHCSLLQLYHNFSPSALYQNGSYGYRSGISNTMVSHLQSYQQDVLNHLFEPLTESDIIIDIGCNDGTTLKFYPSYTTRIGIDPTIKQFNSYYQNTNIYKFDTYFDTNIIQNPEFTNALQGKKVKIISSICMFYDLPNPLQFAKDIYSVLDEDGIWTCEQSYLLTMMKRNSIDTICHEHLEYYGLRQIKEIADLSGFSIIDVQLNDSNGGSFRIYFAKTISGRYGEAVKSMEEKVLQMLNDEIDYGLHRPETYELFVKRCFIETEKTVKFINSTNVCGNTTYIYGASTKGNCLLQFANITKELVPFAVERNPLKYGCMTSTGSFIISEDEMRTKPPNYLLVLPYHFKEEIIMRESAYLEGGGILLFPLPTFSVYTHPNVQKVLITGSNGHIADYVIERFLQHNNDKNNKTKYALFGCSKTNTNNKTNKIPTFPTIISTIDEIKPDIIIHLAGISSSIVCHENPIDSLETNGLLTAKICDYLHSNVDLHHIRFINASSSEIYKGHGTYTVKEGDTNYKHLHPYSIAKIMGHSMVDFYREKHGRAFSNAIIFTTESVKKSGNFLLHRIATFIRNYKNNVESNIKVGNLDSFRNILHTSDVANALFLISTNNRYDNYVVANTNTVLISDIVKRMFAMSGISINCNNKSEWIDEKTGSIIVYIMDKNYDDITTNIHGEVTRLYELGWKPTLTIDDIIREKIE